MVHILHKAQAYSGLHKNTNTVSECTMSTKQVSVVVDEPRNALCHGQ